MGGSGGGGRGGGAGTSGSGSGSPSAAFVAGRSDSGSGDRNLRTDPRSSSSGAPSAAPWRGADTRGAIGAWSPTGAPNVNGAPLAAPSEAGADVGGTADGLTIPDEEDGAERSGERSRTSYDSGLGRGSPTTLTLGGPDADAAGVDTGLISSSTTGASTTGVRPSVALKGAKDPKMSVSADDFAALPARLRQRPLRELPH